MPPEQPLVITKTLVDKMILHAESGAEECCGFLLGHDEGTRIVTEVVPARNVADYNKEKQFAIDPLEYLSMENYATKHAIDLVGIYHSHPNHPAIPSEHDRTAAQPYFSYVILSLMNSKFQNMKSWRLDSQQKFIEEPINQPL